MYNLSRLDPSYILEVHRFVDAANIEFVFGKKTKDRKSRKDVKPTLGVTFKKKSIFFEYLPYWIYNTRSMVCTSRRTCSKA